MLKSILTLGVFVFTSTVVYAQKNAVNRNYSEDYRNAIRFIENEKYEDAQDLLEDIPEQDSLYLQAQYRLQQLYNRSENFPKVIEISPRLSRLPFNGGNFVYNNWALALSNMEKYDEALAVTLEGLKAYSESHLLHYRHGMVLQELNRHQEAMQAYQRAIQAYPMHTYSHLKLGEMAAHEGRHTQAIMSLVYATILDDTPGFKASIHATLEKIAVNDFDAEPKNLVFDKDDDFTEIDRIIQSKIALSPKFKVKTKIKAFAYTRQLQVLCEAMYYDGKLEGFWMQHYAEFYQAVFQNEYFDALTYVSLYGPEYGKINASAFKNTKKRDAFVSWFASNFDRFIAKQFIEFEGKKQRVYIDLGQQNVIGRGLGNGYTNRIGEWQLFDGLNGRPIGKGEFKDGKRHGEWDIYDETTGLLSRRLVFDKGNLNGLFTSYAPNGKPDLMVNMKDDLREGQRVVFFPSGDTLIIDNHEKGRRTGDFVQFHPNNSIRLSGMLINDQWFGDVLEYHTNGQLNASMKYKADKKDGDFTSYYIDGKVKQKGKYEEDKVVGDFESYFSNGQLERKGRYKNDVQVGKWLNYYSNGQLEEELEYDDNGKLNAIQKGYDIDGKPHYEMEYKSGELQSFTFYDKTGKILARAKRDAKNFTYKYYNPRGVLKIEGAFEKDKKTGVWTYFSDYGTKDKEVNYVDGKVDGKTKTFYPNGEVNVVENYVKDELDGLILAYHPNKELRAEGYYSKGERTGMWYFYHPDGNLRIKQYYVAGEVVGWSEEYAVNGLLSTKFFHENKDIQKAAYFDVLGNPLDTVDNYHGEVLVPNPNGKDILARNHFKNDARHGYSESYYLDGRPSISGEYFNKVRHGMWTEYYENGQISAKTKYVHGEKDSVKTEYRMNGNVATRTPYKNDVIDGVSEHYHPNGKLHYNLTYAFGNRQGEAVMKLPTGEIYAVFYYDNGVLVAYSYEGSDGKLKTPIDIEKDQEVRCFFKSGAPSLTATRTNGVWHDDYIVYNPKGEIIEKKNYAHGELNGESVFNLSSKQRYSSINYSNGFRHGQMKLYHLNGTLMLESTYVFGEKHGEEKEHDKNGKAIFSRSYYNGQMITEIKL